MKTNNQFYDLSANAYLQLIVLALELFKSFVFGKHLLSVVSYIEIVT